MRYIASFGEEGLKVDECSGDLGFPSKWEALLDLRAEILADILVHDEELVQMRDELGMVDQVLLSSLTEVFE